MCGSMRMDMLNSIVCIKSKAMEPNCGHKNHDQHEQAIVEHLDLGAMELFNFGGREREGHLSVCVLESRWINCLNYGFNPFHSNALV